MNAEALAALQAHPAKRGAAYDYAAAYRYAKRRERQADAQADALAVGLKESPTSLAWQSIATYQYLAEAWRIATHDIRLACYDYHMGCRKNIFEKLLSQRYFSYLCAMKTTNEITIRPAVRQTATVLPMILLGLGACAAVLYMLGVENDAPAVSNHIEHGVKAAKDFFAK